MGKIDINKVLVFDIWADYAHFKKYYTTTSPLTFSIPPKTTLYGIIGAILGLSKDNYLNYFKPGQCKIGIQIKKPIKKTRVNLNLIDTKSAKLMARIDNRTRIKTELLKDVKYRIYFWHSQTSTYQKLKSYLVQHKTVYSISLGLSECLANFRYIAEYELQKIDANNSWLELITVLRIDTKGLSKADIDFTQEDREYLVDKLALEMKPNREVVDYGQIVLEKKGRSIRIRPGYYYQLETEEKILLL
ncbi:type I-B CRISPR-associated protein Cas5b [Fuchsiella alkaliacetigena]|uniref:type I-B CRISPR-associated protein Cas5b n=1 Tax=Fuchsiella alkaliacetigena TaxID=957042 RepID=UPI00200A9C34|nr:type I-B CRISPR-associated protein Cas5b [Fuchsiella alkaliacetigena]